MADDSNKCGAVMQMAQNTRQPVDVIFALDTSGSMREEIDFVHQNMNAFSTQIRASGIDVHVIVLSSQKGEGDGLLFTDGVCIAAPLGSGMCPADSNPPTYVHIPELIGQWSLLDAYIVRYPDYRQHLRENSLKTFVGISDDNASTSADKFMSDVQALEPNSPMWSNWRYSAIYTFTPCLGSSGVGTTQADLVKRTNGVGGDLCLQDFKPVFDAIAMQLVKEVELACDWAIPEPPTGETFEPTKTNVRLVLDGQSEALLKTPSSADCGAREAWHYDDEAAPTRVVACPSTCARIRAAVNAEVSVLFGCSTQIVPD